MTCGQTSLKAVVAIAIVTAVPISQNGTASHLNTQNKPGHKPRKDPLHHPHIQYSPF